MESSHIHFTEFNSVSSACNTDNAQLAVCSLVSTGSPTGPTAPSSPPSGGSGIRRRSISPQKEPPLEYANVGHLPKRLKHSSLSSSAFFEQCYNHLMMLLWINNQGHKARNAMFLDNVSETDSKDVNDMVDTDNIDKEMSFETDWYQYESDNEPTYEESVVEDEQIVEPKEVKIDYTTVDDPALQPSIKIFQYAKKKGVSREALDDIIGMVNNHMKAYCSEAPLLYSHYKSKERLTMRFPVKSKALDVCKNGCMLYDENAQIDEKCSNSKCEGNKIDAKNTMYLPLICQPALLVNDKETFGLLKSPRKNEKWPNILYGAFDGAFGEKLPKAYSKKKGQIGHLPWFIR
ncbi:hypothetical protein RMCBS344292_11354 [Rhizopus microsporus]|nr:hypothetical protein RMCBS344292_11354 [Rhizopus microsporus]